MSKPPLFRRKKRKRSKVGRKKRPAGLGKQEGSNKRHSDTTDDTGCTSSAANSSEFSDSEGFNVPHVKEEGAELASAQRLRSSATGSSMTQREAACVASKALEAAATPAAKRRKVMLPSSVEFKSEPSLLPPAPPTSSSSSTLTPDRPGGLGQGKNFTCTNVF